MVEQCVLMACPCECGSVGSAGPQLAGYREWLHEGVWWGTRHSGDVGRTLGSRLFWPCLEIH
jgi:hypothetical protein